MWVRKKTTPNSPRCSAQIVKTLHVPGTKQKKQLIVRHLGVAQNEQHYNRLKEIGNVIIAQIKMKEQIARDKANPQTSLFDLIEPKEKTKALLKIKQQTIKSQRNVKRKSLKVDLKKIREEKRLITGVHDVYGSIYEQLDLDKLLPKALKSVREVLFHCIMARIASPDSKRATVQNLDKNFGYKIPLEKVYRAMDHLDDDFIKRLQKSASRSAQGLLNVPVQALFFDCTTLYFESFKTDDLKQPGYSKDAKFKESQVLMALMVTEEGLPVGFEILPGASFEGKSLLPVIDRMKTQFELKKAVCVADRGMFNSANLRALKKAGVQYIVGAKLKQLSKKQKDFILSQKGKLVSATGGDRYVFLDHGDDKIIVTYSRQRSLKDKKDRDKMLCKLKKKLNTNRSAKSLLGNNGSRKFLKLREDSKVSIDEMKLEKEALWDGLSGVVTNASDLGPEQIFSHRSGLWQVEETFRVSKHDLRIRPIYHWTPRRVKAHLAMAFMCLMCVRHLEYRVKVQFKKMSPKAITNCLIEVQHSIVKHLHTKKRYSIPSKMSLEAVKIYRLMGLKSSLEPCQLN